MMNKSDMWLTLLASIGVGAAAYYSISKSNKPIEKAIENITPMLTNTQASAQKSTHSMSNHYERDTTMGPHGMS